MMHNQEDRYKQEEIVEIWKPIKGYENKYQVSNLGKVKSIKRISERGVSLPERIMRHRSNSLGYQYVSLCKNGKHKTFTVHRLVAITFIPNPEDKPQVNHKNGITADNRTKNLEWATQSENTQHAYDTGLQEGIRGEKNASSKLTKEDVLFIRENPEGSTYRQLAEKFNVSPSLVYRVMKRKQWKHI